MSAKPALGYGSRTEAVFALRSSGATTRQIAAKLGVTTSIVSSLEHSANRARKPRPAEQMGRTVVFPTDILDALRPHAARRWKDRSRFFPGIANAMATQWGGIADEEQVTA